MTRLHELRKRLASLRRRRQRVRLGTGYSAILLAVLWITAAAFLVDWLLEMDRLQRMISLVVCAGLVLWAFRRYTLPWLGFRETDIDMALLVERVEDIDSDLIAAVQFESPEAPQWGSVQLEQAVIDSVADTGKRLNVMRGLSRRELSRRTVLLVVTAIACVGIFLAAPDHVTAFLKRFFLLSPIHYPTDTIIESITIKGQSVDSEDPEAAIDWSAVKGQEVDPLEPGKGRIDDRSEEGDQVVVLFGQRVRLEVICSGELPDDGRVELTAKLSGLNKTIKLGKVPGESDRYAAELDPLREEIQYELYLGDAYTDPGVISVTTLPVVTVEIEVEPPTYATQENAGPILMPIGLRQFSVIEGSRVRIKLLSDKPLESAGLTLLGQAGEKPAAFQQADSDDSGDPRDIWVLDEDESPLAEVTELIRYAIQVTDQDGQHLDRPIEGVIRIQADSAPRVAAGIITQYVLPAAAPTVYFQALDDYGLARIWLSYNVEPVDGREVEPGEIDLYRLRSAKQLRRSIAPSSGFALDFAALDLGLKKGDKMVVTLRAQDYRGRREGKTAAADPLVFQVTDLEGVLAGVREADRQSAERLKTMIRRQLGIGESPH